MNKRRASGLDTICRACHNAKQIERKHGPRPKPGALVLIMPPRPEPPPAGSDAPCPGEAAQAPREPEPRAHYASEVEKFLGALQPPPGAADALLCLSLRHLAAMADGLGLGSLNPVQELSTLTQRMIQVQRELAATRAAKASSGTSPVATKGKFEAFKTAK